MLKPFKTLSLKGSLNFIILASFSNQEDGWFCAEKGVEFSVRLLDDVGSYFSMMGEAYPHSNLSFSR